MKNYRIDIQHASKDTIPVSNKILKHWAKTTLLSQCNRAELSLRFVDRDEITKLNHDYRQHNKPTNVLAFPAQVPEQIVLSYPFLGDVIICPSVLQEECVQLHKSLHAHYALMIVHGILHLLGFDHIEDHDAHIMQTLETKLLRQLGFDNPYPIEE